MKVKIQFEVEVPDKQCTPNELEAFLRFSFHDNGELSGRNPFIDDGAPEPIYGTFNWEIVE